MAAYATASDLAARYDIRIWGQLISDDGAELSRFDMLAHPFVTVALGDAAGDTESHLRRTGMYLLSELTALTGNALNELVSINCAIAMAKIVQRRPGSGLKDFREAVLADYSQILKDFRDGLLTFGLSQHQEASFVEVAGPTSLQLENTNSLASRMAPRYLPDPATRLPFDRG